MCEQLLARAKEAAQLLRDIHTRSRCTIQELAALDKSLVLAHRDVVRALDEDPVEERESLAGMTELQLIKAALRQAIDWRDLGEAADFLIDGDGSREIELTGPKLPVPDHLVDGLEAAIADFESSGH